MATNWTQLRARDRSDGFSLVELLVVLGVVGILATIVVPQLMDALDRSRQRATMGHMREVATANSLYYLDNGEYAPGLNDLSPQYFENAPLQDAWGNNYRYIRWLFFDDMYWLWSYGSDGRVGPFVGGVWISEPTEGDMIMAEGVFFMAPTGS